MVRKRGLDNIYERSRKRSPASLPSTELNKEKNILSDNLLNLYRQQITDIKASTSNQNEVIVLDNDTETVQTDKLKDVESLKTPSKSVKKGEKNKSKALTLKYSSITFDDVGGMDNILKEILKMFVHLKVPHVFQELGIPPVRGFLLHGPPGCGKTHIARAIAGELELPFIEVAATELVCGISGESESKIRETFDEAIKIGKCILFIDEIDAISPKRETTDRGMERRMVAQMLKCLDELNDKDTNFNVMVIGATNIPDYIDPALRRGGRFDREFAIGIPNEDSRLKIMKVLCRKVKLEPDFDLVWVAHHTPGFVGADLKTLISKALEVGMWRIHEELGNTNRILPDHNCLSDDSSLDAVRNWFKSLNVPDEELKKLCFKLDDFKTALRNCVPYCKREGFASVPDVTWDDIGALEDVKKQLRSAILWPVQRRKFYEDNNLSSTKGILLYGPKGCGKTLLAKAIANECNINFLCVNGAELLSMYFGESEKAVRKCFDRARNSAPCVIFFDEFDALCPSRSSSTVNAAAERVVNQLLTEMDGMQERKQVFVIAATNRLEKIDSAMLRPGRLEKLIYVDLPSPAGRVEILKSLTKNKTCPKIVDELELESIAFDSQCNEFSGADLAYLIREATAKAMEEIIDSSSSDNSLVLTRNHFESAFKVIEPSFSEQDRKYFIKYRLQKSRCT